MTRSIDDQTPERRLLSRRAVTTAAAWSLPVLAVAIATPAAAASVAALNVAITGVCSTASSGPESRGFLVTVSGATLPAGATFFLSAGNSILTAAGIVEPAVTTLSNLTGLSALLTTNVDLAAGDSFMVGFDSSIFPEGFSWTLGLQYGTSDANSSDNLLLIAVQLSGGANVCS